MHYFSDFVLCFAQNDESLFLLPTDQASYASIPKWEPSRDLQYFQEVMDGLSFKIIYQILVN